MGTTFVLRPIRIPIWSPSITIIESSLAGVGIVCIASGFDGSWRSTSAGEAVGFADGVSGECVVCGVGDGVPVGFAVCGVADGEGAGFGGGLWPSFCAITMSAPHKITIEATIAFILAFIIDSVR